MSTLSGGSSHARLMPSLSPYFDGPAIIDGLSLGQRETTRRVKSHGSALPSARRRHLGDEPGAALKRDVVPFTRSAAEQVRLFYQSKPARALNLTIPDKLLA